MLSRRSYLLFGVFFISLLLFNFPILSIFSQLKMYRGIPIVLIYIFTMWLVVIFFIWLLGDTPQYLYRFFRKWQSGKKK